jgi:hypothetical protein
MQNCQDLSWSEVACSNAAGQDGGYMLVRGPGIPDQGRGLGAVAWLTKTRRHLDAETAYTCNYALIPLSVQF